MVQHEFFQKKCVSNILFRFWSKIKTRLFVSQNGLKKSSFQHCFGFEIKPKQLESETWYFSLILTPKQIAYSFIHTYRIRTQVLSRTSHSKYQFCFQSRQEPLEKFLFPKSKNKVWYEEEEWRYKFDLYY